MDKPFNQAAENNKQPILEVISTYFKAGNRILEVGSCTAQHAIYFSQHLPRVFLIPSETPEKYWDFISWHVRQYPRQSDVG